MQSPLSRLLFLPLAAVLGTACLIDTSPQPEKDPCDPSPCTQQGKSTCVNENGTARCLCDPGTVARPSGVCEPVTTANCAEHPGDTSEPDDCISRATTLTLGGAQRQQSIEPIGDYDFFKLDATLSHVYTVTVEPQGSLMPRVDVFDQAGIWQNSHDGRPTARVSFKARATAPYYVRMSHSPVDPSAATGLYALSLSSLGKEDHGDSSAEATNIAANVGGTASPTTHLGKLEYGQDVDWFALSATQGYTYRIDFKNTSGNYVPTLAGFTREDVKEPFLTIRNSFVEIRAATTTTLYLVMYSPQGETGSYAFQVQYYY